ncbi:MAG: hypothetical protein JNL69_01290 [Bacteroidia bacterium]|nr:hypothetical protein [Bacteroidia bacterium]
MKINFLLFFCVCSVFAFAQEYKGTIKVQKKGGIATLIYDEVNMRLVGKDNSGNILDSAVVSFRIKTTIKGIAYDETIQGTTLSNKMQYQLSRLDNGTTLYFSEIKVRDKSGTFFNWNDLKIKTGYRLEKDY